MQLSSASRRRSRLLSRRSAAKARAVTLEPLEARWLLSGSILRVVSYNMEADINGVTTPRSGFYQDLEGIGEEVVQGNVRPIDILGLQETTSNSTTVAPIVTALNSFYNGLAVYAQSPYQGTQNGSNGSGNGPNAMIYNTLTLNLLASVGVGTPTGSGNGEYRQVVRYEFQPLGDTGTTGIFYVYVSHMKSGTTSSDAADRGKEATIIRNNEATLPANSSVIYMGDLNSSPPEAEFTNFTASGPGQAFDQVNFSTSTTYWSDSSTDLRYRDDYQLITQNILNGTGNINYVTGSFHVFANNGTIGSGGKVTPGSNTALNSDLVQDGGSFIPASTLYADLATGSDHLPVVCDYSFSITIPVVTAVYVRGSAWTQGFLNSLATSGQGDATFGYRIPTGSNAQLHDLAWSNLDQISIAFSENVHITQATLGLLGANIPPDDISGFTYDPATCTATWTLALPLNSAALQLTLASSGPNAVTDLGGNAIDGEWTDGVSTTSGNGIPGGDFVFHFNVLPGDLNADGIVNASDFDMLSAHFGQSDAAGDFNGDGVTDFADFAVLANNSGATLPAAPADLVASVAPGSSHPLGSTTPTVVVPAPLAPPATAGLIQAEDATPIKVSYPVAFPVSVSLIAFGLTPQPTPALAAAGTSSISGSPPTDHQPLSGFAELQGPRKGTAHSRKADRPVAIPNEAGTGAVDATQSAMALTALLRGGDAADVPETLVLANLCQAWRLSGAPA